MLIGDRLISLGIHGTGVEGGRASNRHMTFISIDKNLLMEIGWYESWFNILDIVMKMVVIVTFLRMTAHIRYIRFLKSIYEIKLLNFIICLQNTKT